MSATRRRFLAGAAALVVAPSVLPAPVAAAAPAVAAIPVLDGWLLDLFCPIYRRQNEDGTEETDAELRERARSMGLLR